MANRMKVDILLLLVLLLFAITFSRRGFSPFSVKTTTADAAMIGH